MFFPKWHSVGVSTKIWLTLAMFLAFSITFGLYAYWEKRIDRANELRHLSYMLANELRQSSDDLTRMARTYVVTGDPRYKRYHQDILAIRDGKKPRPDAYRPVYWDIVVANADLPQASSGQTISFLELMRRANLSDEEFARLAKAKANSDDLVALELEAMKLVESVGADADTNRTRASLMLHDEQYSHAKTAVMRPIDEFNVLMERRTLNTIRTAENVAFWFRILFIATTLLAIFMLWRSYATLRTTLGESAENVLTEIDKIGRGDFSTVIAVAPGMEGSVLAGLSDMRNKLQAYEMERKQVHEFKQAILNSIASEICVLTHDGTIMAVNEPWRSFALENGFEPGKPVPGIEVGANYLAVCNAATGLAANGAMAARNGIQAVLDGRLSSFILEYPCHSPQQQRWFVMSVTPLGAAAQSGVVITHTDITERKLSEQALTVSEQRFSLFMDTLPAAAFIKDEDSTTIYANRYMEEVLGARDWLGKSAWDLFPPELARKMIADDLRSLEAGYVVSEEQVPGTDGQLRFYQTHKFRIPRPAQSPLLGGIALDISERKKAEDSLRKSENLFHNYFELGQVGMAITSIEMGWLEINHRLCEMLGYTKEELVKMTWAELTHPDDLEPDLVQFRRLLSGEIGQYAMDKRFMHKNGSIVYTHLSVACQRNPDNSVEYIIASLQDITERKLMEEQIRQMAFNDNLTNLPNRRLLEDHMSQVMSASKRSGLYGALMFLDLDNFKPLNDTHGHEAGDLLLIEVADRLRSCVREMDTISRFGGDEFVVLLSELDVDKAESTTQAELVAEKIRTTLSKPYLLTIRRAGKMDATIEHHCSASIGVALFVNHEASHEEVLKQADVAMYRSKEAGRNKIWFYEAKTE